MERREAEKAQPPTNPQREKNYGTQKLKVAIVGFGTMGRQIAQLFAQHEHEVTATDMVPDALKSGINEVQNGAYGLQNAVSRGKMSSEEAKRVLRRIRTTPRLEDACRDAEVVVEAAIEDSKLKQEIFLQLDAVTSTKALLASNTSTLSITMIASAASRRKDRVIGLHFFNPAQVTKLVEIVVGRDTSDETVERAIGIIHDLGRTPIIAKDEPGFIANRLGLTLFQEASRIVDEKIASIQDVDNAMKLGYGHPMGPFETADLVGLDTRLRNLQSMHKATGDAKWLPSKTLREMVNQGYLGDPAKKKGKGGYYEYYRVPRQK